jgi:hypothetical protein
MLLPAGSFALAVFGGWAIPTSLFAEELRLGPTAIAAIRALLRYVVPGGIAAASLASLRF